MPINQVRSSLDEHYDFSPRLFAEATDEAVHRPAIPRNTPTPSEPISAVIAFFFSNVIFDFFLVFGMAAFYSVPTSFAVLTFLAILIVNMLITLLIATLAQSKPE